MEPSEGYESLCSEMRGVFTAYVWLTSLYPSHGWSLGSISGRAGLNIGGGTASCSSTRRPVVQRGWVSIPVVSAFASRESSTEDLKRLTVVQLKGRLRGLGLIVSGNKAELVERLRKGINSSTDDGKREDNNDNNGSTTHSIGSSSSRPRRSNSTISENTSDTSMELPPPLEKGGLDYQRSSMNSLVSQDGERRPEYELLDGEKLPTTPLISSYPTNSNDELNNKEPEMSKKKTHAHMEDLMPLSRPKPKRRLLTDDDLLPPKKSKRSRSSQFRG